MKFSIVMAYYNRREQLLNTLESIFKTEVPKEEIEIIIVDDESEECHDIIDLSSDNITIIKLTDKQWENPCVPYNIAISKAKGEWIIIQNPEILHTADLLNFINKDGDPEKYYSPCIYAENIDDPWYSHPIYNPTFYHFCTVIHNSKLKLVGGFNLEMKDGIDYDDIEFLERVKRVCKSCEYIPHMTFIHQWHPKFTYMRPNCDENREKNKKIFENTLKNTNLIFCDPTL
jgi:glycosyltransferase involved in cell wall biosynthesis